MRVDPCWLTFIFPQLLSIRTSISPVRRILYIPLNCSICVWIYPHAFTSCESATECWTRCGHACRPVLINLHSPLTSKHAQKYITCSCSFSLLIKFFCVFKFSFFQSGTGRHCLVAFSSNQCQTFACFHSWNIYFVTDDVVFMYYVNRFLHRLDSLMAWPRIIWLTIQEKILVRLYLPYGPSVWNLNQRIRSQQLVKAKFKFSYVIDIWALWLAAPSKEKLLKLHEVPIESAGKWLHGDKFCFVFCFSTFSFYQVDNVARRL